MKAALRIAAGLVCLLLTGWFLLPLGIGILHIGMIWPSALLLLAASLCFFHRWPRHLPRLIRRTAGAVIAVGLAVVLALSVLMISAGWKRPAEDAPVRTVIVLGCQVYPSGQPSVMLRNRIQAAQRYLAAHPDAVCIASGGRDDSEPITEARCIRDTLVSMGIDAQRIYLEDRSGSTYENLTFSAAVIAENGLDTRVALATDTFHQFRGQLFARQAGLEPLALGCAAYLPLESGYWAREMVAILAAWVRGY